MTDKHELAAEGAERRAGTGVVVEPVGWVSSPRAQPLDDEWGDVISTITLDPARFDARALVGLADFSHVEVVYLFHRVEASAVQMTARHPRGNAAWPQVGVFAQRAKGRPNRIGVSVCELLGVQGITLTLLALDAIDGTPVLDVKPYMSEFAARGEVRQPAWSHELMAAYWERARR